MRVQDAFNWSPGATDTMWSAKVGRFPAGRRRRLTSTQPSRSSRPGSPLSLSVVTDGMWSISAMLGFQGTGRRCGASQVSGSSRQDLPTASCSVGTPPACFFHSAVAVIFDTLVFVTSQSLTRFLCVFLLFLFLLLHPVSSACERRRAALFTNHTATLRERRSRWCGAQTVNWRSCCCLRGCRKYWFPLRCRHTKGRGLSKVNTFQITTYYTRLWTTIACSNSTVGENVKLWG